MASEEVKRDWKRERISHFSSSIAEYAKLENEIVIGKQNMDNDPQLKKLNKELEKLNDMIESAKGSYLRFMEAAQQQQAGIKLELAEGWGVFADKTFECDAGMATLRITKSLHIKSKEKLVSFLTTINKLPDFIKSFETAKLRKIKDAGLLGDEIVMYDEKKSIAIKITEAEQ